MNIKEVSNREIENAEKAILMGGATFNSEQKDFLKCIESCRVQAYAGTGKTTMIVAKLHILAQKQIWKEGRGICVLSHTNVAVDEIKNRVAKSFPEVLQYPNFVGTLQEFINKFLFIPSIAEDGLSMTYQSDERYCPAEVLNVLKNKNSKYGPGKKLFIDNVGEVVGAGFGKIDYDILSTAANSRKIASDHINELRRQGKFLYMESHSDALRYLEKYPLISQIISNRFGYVFLDEAQDCDELQLSIIRKLFGDGATTVLQEVGDTHQSILSDGVWSADGGKTIRLSETVRFGDGHAKFVNRFLGQKEGLCGTGSAVDLCVFVAENIPDGDILWYSQKILKEKVKKEDATIVAIASEHSLLKNYLPTYYPEGTEVRKGKKKFLLLSNITADDLNNQGVRIIRDTVSEQMKVSGIPEGDIRQKIRGSSVRNALYDASRRILSNNDDIQLPPKIIESLQINMVSVKERDDALKKGAETKVINNTYCRDGYSDIELKTIHASKGQTHTATIVLAHVVATRFFDVTKSTGPNMDESIRRMMYVATTRTSSLLIITLDKRQFTTLNKLFSGATIYQLDDKRGRTLKSYVNT